MVNAKEVCTWFYKIYHALKMIDHAKQDKDYFFSSFYVSLFLAVLKFARYRAAFPS